MNYKTFIAFGIIGITLSFICAVQISSVELKTPLDNWFAAASGTLGVLGIFTIVATLVSKAEK